MTEKVRIDILEVRCVETVNSFHFKEDETEVTDMSNVIEFGRMVLSYGLLMVIIVALMALGLFIGINMAKKKNAKALQETSEETGTIVSGEDA